MTDDTPSNTVRERNRDGLRTLNWNVPPAAEEGLIDRLELSVAGSVTSQTPEALRLYANDLSGGNSYALDRSYRLFGAGHWTGQRYRAPIVTGTTVSAGHLQLFRRGEGARITVALTLNPTRTLEHLLTAFTIDEIEGLPVSDFFRLADAPPARLVTLDRRDNMVADMTSFAGRAYRTRVDYLRRYFLAYETALRGLLADHLAPLEQGFVHTDDNGDLLAASPEHQVRINWRGLAVTQCEAYWERQVESAMETTQALADRVLAAARTADIRTHEMPAGASVERVEAALSVRLPLNETGSMALVVYAKALDRIRFEVRYRNDMPQSVRERMTGHRDRLCDWLDAIKSDAAPRVPWAGLQRLLEPLDGSTGAVALLDLIEATEAACSGQPGLRRAILENLLVTGGLSSTGDGGLVPEAILAILVDRGVVEHVRLLRREGRRAGRRYRLTRAYQGLTLPTLEWT